MSFAAFVGSGQADSDLYSEHEAKDMRGMVFVLTFFILLRPNTTKVGIFSKTKVGALNPIGC
jgi:hypothetical protein